MYRSCAYEKVMSLEGQDDRDKAGDGNTIQRPWILTNELKKRNRIMDINGKRPPENERRWINSGGTLRQDRKVIRELLFSEISNTTKQKALGTSYAK